MHFLSDFCHFCLQSNEKLKNLSLQDDDNVILEEKFQYCFENAIKNSPKLICSDCRYHLKIMYNFKMMTIKCNITLTKYLLLLSSHSNEGTSQMDDLNSLSDNDIIEQNIKSNDSIIVKLFSEDSEEETTVFKKAIDENSDSDNDEVPVNEDNDKINTTSTELKYESQFSEKSDVDKASVNEVEDKTNTKSDKVINKSPFSENTFNKSSKSKIDKPVREKMNEDNIAKSTSKSNKKKHRNKYSDVDANMNGDTLDKSSSYSIKRKHNNLNSYDNEATMFEDNINITNDKPSKIKNGKSYSKKKLKENSRSKIDKTSISKSENKITKHSRSEIEKTVIENVTKNNSDVSKSSESHVEFFDSKKNTETTKALNALHSQITQLQDDLKSEFLYADSFENNDKENQNSHLSYVDLFREMNSDQYTPKTNSLAASTPVTLNTNNFQSHSKMYTCKKCFKTYPQSKNLKDHMLTHKRSYDCPICKKSLKCTTSLKTHMLLHNDEKTFECDVCQKRFRHSCTLRVHKVIHTGERPYPCRICNKRFVQKANLRTHLLIHTGKKAFDCKICNKKFTVKCQLKNHMLSHTKERNYPCTVCPKKFMLNGHLKSHMLVHTGEKNFQCALCLNRFKQNFSLLKHIRDIHEGKRKKL